MCIFSERVNEVGKTRIFARLDERDTEFLVYEMHADIIKPETAMILPIPCANQSEDAVQFIDLSERKDFFQYLDSLFPVARGVSLRGELTFCDYSTLTVHQVGSFQASFVPQLKDFSRLDKRFHIPEVAIKNNETYKDYGFVVFKLSEGNNQFHPMAFSFPLWTQLTNGRKVFFPTVHVHDEHFHKQEYFDHTLYSQGTDSLDEISYEKPVDIKGILDTNSLVSRKTIKGYFPNKDLVFLVT